MKNRMVTSSLLAGLIVRWRGSIEWRGGWRDFRSREGTIRKRLKVKKIKPAAIRKRPLKKRRLN